MTENTETTASTVTELAETPSVGSKRRFWHRDPYAKLPRTPRQQRSRKLTKAKPASKPPERVEREWRYSETREPGFPFFGTHRPQRRALRFVSGILYWIKTLLALVFVCVLVLAIIWAIGELRINGYGPLDIWTLKAAHVATWINKNLGGKK